MPTLIDSHVDCTQEINGRWFIAKPITYWGWRNVKDAWLVLIGKATAVYFGIDREEDT